MLFLDEFDLISASNMRLSVAILKGHERHLCFSNYKYMAIDWTQLYV